MLSKHYNMAVESWAQMAGFNAFIVCNNGPRWSAVINYDWLTRLLHFGASCQAQLWFDGKPLGYVPNEKGLRRDEFVVPLDLKPGENILVVKLQRFWERRWLFYSSLTRACQVLWTPVD